MRLSIFVTIVMVVVFSFSVYTVITHSEQANTFSNDTGAPANGMSITMTTNKTVYILGQGVMVYIHIENKNAFVQGIGADAGVRYKITCNGTTVEDGHTPVPGLQGNTSHMMHPGDFEDYSFNISYLRDKFQAPGRYTLQVSWPCDRPGDGDPWDPDPRMNLISNVVEFEILPAEAGDGSHHQQSTAPPQGGGSPQPQENTRPSSSRSTPWPWYAYALIAFGVLIVGGTAYFILSKRKK